MKWGLMGWLGAGFIWFGFWFGISLVYLVKWVDFGVCEFCGSLVDGLSWLGVD